MTTDLKQLQARKHIEDCLTFAEFCDIVDEKQKAHLINGVIFMEPPASILHEELFGFLYFILSGFVSKKKLGLLLGSRTAVRFSDYSATEPDLLFVSNSRRHIVHEQFINGAPDLIVEIVSPGSKHMDRVSKKKLYGEAGVREYWLIDPVQQLTEFFTNQDGGWQKMPLYEKGVVISEAVPDFWLRIDWLFAQELPGSLDVLNLILKHNPMAR